MLQHKAMGELARSSGHRKIQAGPKSLHSQDDAKVLEATLSGTARGAWRGCSPDRFGKPYHLLSEDEVAALAMAGFILA